jgi:pyruvyltransferase
VIQPTFWWRGTPNFGDVLAKVLIDRLTRHTARWAPPSEAKLAVIGSIATMLPADWHGIALGIGYARPAEALRFARVLALRGVLSQQQYGQPVDVLGDPGLLVPQILPPVKPEYDLVVVPHWQDLGLAKRYPGRKLVSVRQAPLEVVDQIRRARRVVSSSLHCIIVADAYGIERRWETFDKVQGSGFKFRDHATVVGAFEPDEWGFASAYAVRNAQAELLELFQSL